MISEAIKDQILNEYINGVSIKALHKKYGISRTTISKWVNKIEKGAWVSSRSSNTIQPTTREYYSNQLRDKILLAYVDFSELIHRRLKFISALPMNEIENGDLTTLNVCLKGLADFNPDANKTSDSVLETLQAYLISLNKSY